MKIESAFLFDLDGTLVDSVYQHVLSWKEALGCESIELSVWRIHRKVGMSGGLLGNQLLRETGVAISQERIDCLQGCMSKLTCAVRETFDRCPARVSFCPGSPTATSDGRLQPAAGWRRRAPVLPRSASTLRAYQ